MTGLEFMIKTYGITKSSVAEELGIKKQNINIWFSGKQLISKRHVEHLAGLFHQPVELIRKEITKEDELAIIDNYKKYKAGNPSVSVYYAILDLPKAIISRDENGNIGVIPLSTKCE